jgi:cell division GTPase FtsZ
MKLIVIGLGQCGSRIADEFARLNKRAKSQRGIEICPGVFAVNTDSADLSGLVSIKPDYQHRILIGSRKTGGHGVGKINELAAEIAKEDADKVIDAMRNTKNFYEADAFLLVASTGGGTGSGSLPIMVKTVKERYYEKPVYAMTVLPFEHEQQNEERAVYNTAVCLKSVYSVADAVFVVDNQRYVRKDQSLRYNLDQINESMVEPFYNLLSAGEEKNAKKVGSKTLDAGDTIQSLAGWTVLGHSATKLGFGIGFKRENFINKTGETHKGIQSMDRAISELSATCDAQDAGRAMYLISAPPKEINMGLIKELGDWLKDLAPNAIIRNGDYPTGDTMDITVILSELADIPIVREYYSKSTQLMPVMKMRQQQVQEKLNYIDEVGKDVPTVF